MRDYAHIAKVSVACQGDDCVSTAISGSELEQPGRLRTTDRRVWQAPRPAAAAGGPVPASAGAERGQPVVISSAKRLTPLGSRSVTPVLPPELAGSGLTVWGVYRICVDAGGQVERVDVVQSAMPGGLDGAWVAKIEKWQYQPFVLNGRPLPFCYVQRLQVQSPGDDVADESRILDASA